MRFLHFPGIAAACLAVTLTACSSTTTVPLSADGDSLAERAPGQFGRPYRVHGKTYVPLASSKGYREVGVASWYGYESGNRTATGGRFDPLGQSAAHKTLPLFCRVRVTNLENGRSTVVVINDRGPFAHNRLIDVSQGAAERLQLQRKGSSRVLVEALN